MLDWLNPEWTRELAALKGAQPSSAIRFYAPNLKQITLPYSNRYLNENHAYRCFCHQEELQYKREKMMQKGADIVYDGTCKHLSHQQIQ